MVHVILILFQPIPRQVYISSIGCMISIDITLNIYLQGYKNKLYWRFVRCPLGFHDALHSYNTWSKPRSYSKWRRDRVWKEQYAFFQ
jgi:hypothetical protein